MTGQRSPDCSAGADRRRRGRAARDTMASLRRLTVPMVFRNSVRFFRFDFDRMDFAMLEQARCRGVLSSHECCRVAGKAEQNSII